MSDSGYNEDAPVQPLRDGDTSIDPDPSTDPAQAEWDATTAADEGVDLDALGATATGADPAEIPSPDDQIPAEDQHFGDRDVETQGTDPLDAELGEEGQGDLSPEDI